LRSICIDLIVQLLYSAVVAARDPIHTDEICFSPSGRSRLGRRVAFPDQPDGVSYRCRDSVQTRHEEASMIEHVVEE
jgi:hypothetical protein